MAHFADGIPQGEWKFGKFILTKTCDVYYEIIDAKTNELIERVNSGQFYGSSRKARKEALKIIKRHQNEI